MLHKKKNYKVYLHIKSFYFYYLERDLKNLFFFIKKNNLFFFKKKVNYLPISIKKFSVVKSPFVSKLSKEQFEIRTYKLMVTLYFKNYFFFNFLKKNKILFLNFDYSYIRLIYCYTYK